MVPLVNFFLLRKHKQFCFIIPYSVCSFLSSFSLTVFIKFFLIQNSKSSANLNHKELKQEGATIDQSTTISDSWGMIVCNLSCAIYPWDNVLGG